MSATEALAVLGTHVVNQPVLPTSGGLPALDRRPLYPFSSSMSIFFSFFMFKLVRMLGTVHQRAGCFARRGTYFESNMCLPTHRALYSFVQTLLYFSVSCTARILYHK